MVLSYSRLLWLRFYPRQTMAVLIDGLESAFAQFGGVPSELPFDQMRAAVLSDDRTAHCELVLNAEFLRFAAHWGFMPRSCRPQTKGKVERPIRAARVRGGRAMKPTPNSRRERVREMLADLKMPGALEAVDDILASADSGPATASEAIEQLLRAQVELRNNRGLQSAMRSSRLPAVKTPADFDFAFQPSINCTTCLLRDECLLTGASEQSAGARR